MSIGMMTAARADVRFSRTWQTRRTSTDLQKNPRPYSVPVVTRLKKPGRQAVRLAFESQTWRSPGPGSRQLQHCFSWHVSRVMAGDSRPCLKRNGAGEFHSASWQAKTPWNIGIGQAPANLRTRDTFLQSICMGVAASGLFTLCLDRRLPFGKNVLQKNGLKYWQYSCT